MELEVEEDARAPIDERADERRPFQREQAAADLEAAGEVFERVGQFERTPAALDVERD